MTQSSHHRPKATNQTNAHKPFAAKKSLGQNFLTSPIVPRWMCDAGFVSVGDTILEIGPGTGVLTREILARGANVIAIETDIRAITVLKETFVNEIASQKLILVTKDIRTVVLSTLKLHNHNFKIIANIPYYLSGFLLRTLLENNTQPSVIVFLMQKEVVARIARCHKESLLSLSVKCFGTPLYIKTVTRGHFNPIPKVDSAILLIKNISRQHFRTSADQALFFTILHLGFGQKRKQLLSNLAQKYQRATLEQIFNEVGLPTTARAEDVVLSKWLSLTASLLYVPKLSTDLTEIKS